MTEDAPTPAAPGSHVFVSYASQDGAVANSIVESLESQGLRCWIAPRDVKPGAQYADAIVRAINEAKAVVLVMSASAVASSHVGKEIERASSKRKPIIAFRIDAAPLNHALEYFLSESQWIDVRALGMAAALNKINGAVGQGSATSSQAVPDRPSGRVGKRAGIAAAVVVAISVAVGLGFYIWKSNHGAAQTPAVAAITDKSIAVLPFVDMSEKKDQEYFGDGMAEEIIDLLVKVPGLKVTGRTSSFQFKGHTEDLRTVGEKLGVRYVLEGSIRKSGDRLRVTAQLVDSRTGTHLLSQTYDRDLSDVLKMQDEIAASLVRALQIEVSAAYLDSRSSLRNPNAYTLYLKAWHVLEQYDQQGLEQAASYFQQALDLDPSFADAADGLASTYIFLAAFGFMPTSVAYDKARLAVEHALKLDPKLAMAHAILGDIHYTYDWDWPAADRELKMALRLTPNDNSILQEAAGLAGAEGRWDDSLLLLNASLAQDPLDPTCHIGIGWTQFRRGQLVEAEAAMRHTLAISPTFTFAHYFLGLVLLARNEPESALAEMLKETADSGRLEGSAMAYFALGRKGDSDAALAELLRSHAGHPYGVAGVYAFRGESGEAFKWLDRAYLQKDASLYHIKGDPRLKNLENDPRYKAFLKKMNLPE